MLSQNIISFELSFTVATSKALIICMCALVLFQISPGYKRLWTHFTGERFFSCMLKHVTFHVNLLSEFLLTNWTLKWFITCMNPHMTSKFAPRGEYFLTHLTSSFGFSYNCYATLSQWLLAFFFLTPSLLTLSPASSSPHINYFHFFPHSRFATCLLLKFRC